MSDIKERPILFSAPMVRAIQSGHKTQTRRIMKRQPYTLRTEGFGYPTKAGGFVAISSPHCLSDCPYGQIGERLWVRETWAKTPAYVSVEPYVAYRADYYPPISDFPPGHGLVDGEKRWRPAIHMFRWASRILLEITSVRVQPLQQITEADARAEGITDGGCIKCGNSEQDCGCLNPSPDARDAFCGLWDSINGKRAPWISNPWVWVIEFKKATQ